MLQNLSDSIQTNLKKKLLKPSLNARFKEHQAYPTILPFKFYDAPYPVNEKICEKLNFSNHVES